MILYKKIKFTILIIICVFLSSSIGTVIVYKYIPIKHTPLMIIRWLNNTSNKYISVGNWIQLEKISPSVLMAAIVSEDLKFIIHRGFDWESIKNNIKYNSATNSQRGGSTISQQTAKNVFLIPNKLWIRKFLELYFTFLIEIIWGKERILEVYLNVIEYGHEIYGIDSASKYFFNKQPADITIDEAVVLIVCFPSPLNRSPHELTKDMKERVNKIKQLINNYPINPNEIYNYFNESTK